MADADACAGGDSTRRKMDAPADSATEIVPVELYDLARAKIAANLRWICAKAYGIDNIPNELKDPFYVDQYEEEHIKPPVIKLLLSSELYCRVCSLILKGDQVAALKGHESVIQALFRKGIYVIESDDTPVAELDLSCAPIKMSPHMAMIDALMMAYTVEMISIEKVVASVTCFSTFSASKELPYDLEDAMIFWINKVNLKMREITEKEVKQKQHLLESPGHQKVRYRRDHLSNRPLPFFPLLEDLMNDCSNGAALLAVVHYYCPEHMKLEEICLKEVTSIADSIYNIRLLREFSNEYLSKCFYLTVEDMLYAPLVLKPNMMVFIAELFWWFENVKPDFVQPRDLQEVKDAKTMLQQKGSRLPVPISKATKRSFMVNPAASSSADIQLPVQLPLETCISGKGNPAFSPSHPLLPLRQKQQKSLQGEDSSDQRLRSNSLTRVDGQPQDSILAWPETKQRPLSQPAPFTLHYAASSDADPSSGDSISLARSISKDSLASNIVHSTPKQQPQSAPVKSDGKSLLNNVEIEDEDEELIAVICPDATSTQGNLELQSVPARSSSLVASAWAQKSQSEASKNKTDSFFLEPLMPAVLRPAKEKQPINKEDECGEGKKRSFVSKRVNEGHIASVRKKASSNQAHHSLRTFVATSGSELSATGLCIAPASVHSEARGEPFHPQAVSSLDTISLEQSSAKADEDLACSTNIGSMKSPNSRIADTPWTMIGQDTDLEILDMEIIEEDSVSDDHPIIAKYIGEEESAKLQEDMKVKEHDDKDDASGRSSPCLSTVSQISSSSVTSGSARMTNFAERKLQRLNNYETKSTSSSSQKTTPDGSECSSLLTTWKQKGDHSPNRQIKDNDNLLASELAQLHMQLEEKRRVIEAQKTKKEVLSARQRLKLGKAAFLGMVKKGKGPDVAQPPKPEHFTKEHSKHNERGLNQIALNYESEVSYSDEVLEDSLEMPNVKAREPTAFFEQSSPKEPTTHEIEKGKISSFRLLEDNLESTERDLPIEKLNDLISVLRQDIMKFSQQQELLVQLPTVSSTGSVSQDRKIKTPVHFAQPSSPTHMSNLPKPPCLGQGWSPPLGRPSELKEGKERPQAMMCISTSTSDTDTLPHLRQFPTNNSSNPQTEATAENNFDPDSTSEKQSFHWLCDERNQQAGHTLFFPKDTNILSEALKDVNINIEDISCSSGKENIPAEESMRIKGNLIEVDLSDLKAPDEEEKPESQGNPKYMMDEIDQKSGVSFFFKDGQKAEDELAKKRAAFLLKQQRKAEETRLRKLQFEAEAEQKRDEARRKAEEDRIRKEEEKARRELIKQEHLRRKHQQNLEEQGRGKPKPKPKPKQPRPISVHREEPCSNLERKCSSIPDNLSSAQSGSSLSLASAATTEPESVNSGGAPSKRVKSMETLPILSRNPSRNTERDWENTSAASSVASVAEYTGPKMFKEPLGKSNKSIIHNAISHCCLAGKVNEPHKNSILEELKKCDAKHCIILFRDAGCQFRALYCFNPETEEIYKLTGTGPKSITKKMIDKLYKYSSDRKQFSVIPAKTMSACVDALTIHNHLWHPKPLVVPKKSSTHK